MEGEARGNANGTNGGAGIEIRILAEEDAPLLRAVAPDVFDGPVDPRWSAEFLVDPRHHLAVALDEGRVVGMASALHYVHPDKAPELWINEVGVAATHRRRGLAAALLAALFAHGRSLGCREAWVATDEDNTAARRLYASAGGNEARHLVVTFDLAAAD